MLKEKKKLLWAAVIAGILCVLAVLLCLLLPKPKPAPLPTEPTLPPPEKSGLQAQDFAFKDGYLTCLSRESVLGIDVSTHQGDIDWQQVKAAGIRFAMVRIGYRGTDQGGLYEDENAQKNYEGAKNAGLQVGGYFFSQATSVEEAQQEAAFALSVTKDWLLDMPLVFDWEYTGDTTRVANVTARTLTDATAAFCEAVKAAGRTPMVYFNTDQGRELLYLRELTDYGFWLAMYTDTFDYEHRVDMWQYTDAGSVPGIAGNVDIDLYFPGESSCVQGENGV